MFPCANANQRRDGLRSLHPDEFPQLNALLGEVFRPGMPQEYPHIYTPDDTANLRVVVDGGEVLVGGAVE